MTKSRNTLFIVLALLMVMMPFTGCTKQATESKDEVVAGTSGESLRTDEEASQAKEGFSVVFVPYNSGNPYYDPIFAGLKDAVTEYGGTFEVAASDNPDPTGQIPIIRAQIQNKVDCIAVDPTSVDALNEVFTEARDAGIKVILVGDDIVGNEQYRDAWITYSNQIAVADEILKIAAEKINYEGQLVISSGTTEAPSQNAQIDAIMKTIETDPKYSKMSIAELTYCNDEPDKAYNQAEAVIQKYPNLKAILPISTVSYVASCQVIENAGLQDAITIVGTAFPNQAREFLKSDIADCGVLWDTYRLGYVGGEFISQYLLGQTEISAGTKFVSKKYGEYVMDDSLCIVAGPPLIFDVNNVDDYNF